MNKLKTSTYVRTMIPFMFATVTQPLLGAVDTAVMGKLDNPTYLAGVSVGAVLFNTIYWLLGFLRVSTTALSSQAQDKPYERTKALILPCVLAMLFSTVFLVFQDVILTLAMNLYQLEPEVRDIVKIYFKILIWGAPFVLTGYVLLGWLMGQLRVKQAVVMQFLGNLINIILDILFVFVFEWKTFGVAAATLVSQMIALSIGVGFIVYGEPLEKIPLKKEISIGAIWKLLKNNTYLVLRTACLLVFSNVFTLTGALFGTVVLSANSVLIQIESMIAYLFEGIGNASSIYSGKAVGEHNKKLLTSTWNLTIIWGTLVAVICSGIYYLYNKQILYIFTNLVDVIEVIEQYKFWIVLYPFVAMGGLTLYGVFTGASATKPIFLSTLMALILALTVRKIAVPIYENHGLWMSLLTFYLGRSLFLFSFKREVIKKI